MKVYSIESEHERQLEEERTASEVNDEESCAQLDSPRTGNIKAIGTCFAATKRVTRASLPRSKK